MQHEALVPQFQTKLFILVFFTADRWTIYYSQLNAVCSTSVRWFCVCGWAHMSCHVWPQAPAPKAYMCWTALSGSLPPFLNFSLFSLHLIPVSPGTARDCARTEGAHAVLTLPPLKLSRLSGVTKTVNILDSVERKTERLQLDFQRPLHFLIFSTVTNTSNFILYNHT